MLVPILPTYPFDFKISEHVRTRTYHNIHKQTKYILVKFL